MEENAAGQRERVPRADYSNPPIELVRLGRTLRALRESRGMKQIEVATAAGMVESQVSDVERGKNNPGWLNLVRMLEAMEVSVAEFGAAHEERLVEPEG